LADYDDYVWLIRDPLAKAHLEELAGEPAAGLAQQRALRRCFTAERARLLIEQADLRRRAVKKFGDLARRLFFTPQLLEQATDLAIALYKAHRFASRCQPAVVHDYCCGIGGDAIMLAARLPTHAWDLSAIACLLAGANLEAVGVAAEVTQADVAELTPAPDEAWHVDPDRRATGSRSTTLEQHSPPPQVIDVWLQSSPDGAVKLAPASDAPNPWAAAADIEWISRNRECRQQIVWFGALAEMPGQRRATRLIDADVNNAGHRPQFATITGQPDVACDASHSVGDYLFEPDPAVLAARLLGELATDVGLATLGAGGVYLTGDQPVDHPLLQTFAVIESMPLRTPKIAQALAHRGVGRVEIKKRGVAIDPEKLRRELKLRGDNELTIVLTRIAKREVALLCERLPSSTALNDSPATS
jgi:hypothetical protein